MSDIDTAAADSLKALDLEWPIREADMRSRDWHVSLGPKHKVAALQPAARGQCTRSTKSLRDSEASGLSESTFASAKDLNDEPR